MIKRLIQITIIMMMFVSCDDANDGGKSTLKLSLTDAPASYDEVNITFTEIAVKAANQNGFEVVSDETQTINLLDWSNGETTPLGEKSLEPGQYSQIRLKIESANVVIDNQTNELTVPSGAQSGLKLNLNFTLEEGSTYEIVLDFDASKSVVMAGSSGKYNLKPTIRAIAKAMSGSISGTISNIDSVTAPLMRAMQGDSVYTSVYPDSLGFFRLSFLPDGSYDVIGFASDSTMTFKQTGISVTNGSDNSMGTIELTNSEVE